MIKYGANIDYKDGDYTVREILHMLYEDNVERWCRIANKNNIEEKGICFTEIRKQIPLLFLRNRFMSLVHICTIKLNTTMNGNK